ERRMGYSISWLAAHTGAAEALDALKLRPTGEQVDLPTAAFVGASLSTGWYLVVANECDHDLVSAGTLKSLRGATDVLCCSIEEHVMSSSASFWSGGRQVWSVRHDGGDRGLDHLQSWGDLPSIFPEIRAALLAEQAADDEGGVDFVFDIPLEL